MSDFSWTTVLWLLPISVILLVAFTLVCLFWFRGAKTTQVIDASLQFSTDELKSHRAKEAEFLDGYKYLDKDAGRVRIPISRAMELLVQENQGKGTMDWKPITDTYLRGAAFAAQDAGSAAAPVAPVAEGIELQSVPETHAPKGGQPAKGAAPAKAPAKDAGAPAKGH